MKRLGVVEKFNKNFTDNYSQKQVRAYTDLYDDAIKLMKSEDLKAFDLSKETPEMREMYGDNNFGQGCLLARRLVENNVRFVEVIYGGWDMHNEVFDNLETKAAVLDKGLSSLLLDLNRRGMLNETMVVVASEFGRTPTIKSGRNGRDHHPKAYSALLAGGGIKEGFVYGKSDERAHNVVSKKMSPEDLNATIAYAMGINLEEVIFSPSKRPFKVAHDGQPAFDLLG